jgi:hypothetical protein
MPGRLWGASSGRAKATPVVLAVLHEWTQERREAREVLCNRSPDDFQVDTEVLVSDDVPHVRHVLPGYSGVT